MPLTGIPYKLKGITALYAFHRAHSLIQIQRSVHRAAYRAPHIFSSHFLCLPIVFPFFYDQEVLPGGIPFPAAEVRSAGTISPENHRAPAYLPQSRHHYTPRTNVFNTKIKKYRHVFFTRVGWVGPSTAARRTAAEEVSVMTDTSQDSSHINY